MKKLSIIYNVTSACPWDCSICCMSAMQKKDSDELSWEEKIAVVDMIAELSKIRDVRCDISGGELFTDLRHMELLRRLSDSIGKDKIGISISGAYLNEDMVKELSTIINDVELTMDCAPHLPYPSRPKRYHEVAAKAAILLKEENIKVGIQTVLTRDNCNVHMMEEQLKWMCEHHIDSWSFIKFFPVGRGCNHPEKAISDEEWLWYQENLERTVRLQKSKTPQLDYHYLMPNHAKHSTECRCVKKSIGILPNGVVSSCFWALDGKRQPLNPRFLLGKVPEERLCDILENDKAKYWENHIHSCCLFQQE